MKILQRPSLLLLLWLAGAGSTGCTVTPTMEAIPPGGSWQPLGQGMRGGDVWDLTVHEGALIAGGHFTEAEGNTVNRVARWGPP